MARTITDGGTALALNRANDSETAHPRGPQTIEATDKGLARGLWVDLKLGEDVEDRLLQPDRKFVEVGPRQKLGYLVPKSYARFGPQWLYRACVKLPLE